MIRTVLVLLLSCSAVLHAVEVIASGTLTVLATEDAPQIVTYDHIRTALVTGSTGSTYQYRILSLGSSTKTLKDDSSDAVVPGTTTIVPSGSATNTTQALQYLAIDDEFTLFPATLAYSKDPVVVCRVDVLSTDGSTVIANNLELKIDVEGVVDDPATYFPLFQYGSTLPITIPRGGSITLSYDEFTRTYCEWVDRERDATFGRLNSHYPSWTIAFSNGTSWSCTPAGLAQMAPPTCSTAGR